MKQNRIGRLFISGLATLGLLCALTAPAALAQQESIVHVSVPFSFTVGKRTLPAGEYALRPLSNTSQHQMVFIQSKDGKISLIVPTQKIAARKESSRAQVTFKQSGEQYYLESISNYTFGVDLRMKNRKAKNASQING